MGDEQIELLQATIDREIPVCPKLGFRVRSWQDGALVMSAPLEPNRNHCGTAFAGSLNALCTAAGWGSMFLLTQRHDIQNPVVIHRSTIKYHRPVNTPEIVARAWAASREAEQHFLGMFQKNGQSKLDLTVTIGPADDPEVTFKGVYVVLPPGAISAC